MVVQAPLVYGLQSAPENNRGSSAHEASASARSRDNWWFRVFRLELRLNPMSYLVPLFRDPVYYGRIPSLSSLGIACGCAVAMLLLGYGVFVRLEPRHIHHF